MCIYNNTGPGKARAGVVIVTKILYLISSKSFLLLLYHCKKAHT